MPWQDKIDFAAIDHANDTTDCEWLTVYPERDVIEFELFETFGPAQRCALDITDPGQQYGEVYRKVDGTWERWYQAAGTGERRL